jgi:hypothetical protein
MEETARNVDRLVTTSAVYGGRGDRWIVPALYESASKRAGGKPISLVAAQNIVDKVKENDRVLLVDQFAYHPNMPYGETDGPLGAASLARAVQFGLGAFPVIVTGPKDIEVACSTVKAAGLNVLDDYSVAKEVTTAVAARVTFPCVDKDASRKKAADILDEYEPKTVISVETIGPNKKGIKHSGAGYNAEDKDKLPGLEYLFYEANQRGILTIAAIDRGNELGGGAIEEEVRRVTPYMNECRCPCGAGGACAVEADIVFPASISNWAAYAISAMMGCLLKKPHILQDEDTEHRMLEACIMAGAIDGLAGGPIMSVDGVDVKAQQGIINILHVIIENALVGS